MADPRGTRLTSWKEIAVHLRREVRTVIRWEKERGLPVHRIPGGHRRSIFAFTSELDAWAASHAAKEKQQPTPAVPGSVGRLAARAALILAVLALAGLGLARPHHELARVELAGASFDGFDESGRRLWSHTLPGQSDARSAVNRRRTSVLDLTGDRHPDAVAATQITGPKEDVAVGMLLAVDEGGHLLWQRSADDRLSFGAGEFDPPWETDDVMTFSRGRRAFVAWGIHHLTWWPSMLAVFDSSGARIGTYVNAGWIRTSEATADGRYIITGGFSNSRRGAAFAVLEADHPDGSSPEDQGSPYECRNCPAGRPLHYFVIDWSDIASALPPDERSAVVSLHPGTGVIELHAVPRRGADLIVELSSDFHMRRRAVSDAFWDWHQRLEQNGTVAHDREHCPYRNGPIVREWTPARGWRVLGS